MGVIVSTILITVPLAFMVGWLVSKAVFRHLSMVRPGGLVNPVTAPETTTETQKPDIPGRTDNQQMALLEQQLETAQSDKQSAMNEVQLLREANAEREHRMVDLREELKLAHLPPEDTAAGANELKNVKHSKDLRDLQTKVDRGEKDIAALRHELIATEKRIDASKTRFNKWRNRLKPLARQFRQQKLIITELRDEMRQREGNSGIHQQVVPPPPVVAPVEPLRQPGELHDNLECLRGIGPALHGKLNQKGIYRLEQLANLSDMDMRLLARSLGISERQIEKHNWGTQARQLLGTVHAPEPQADRLINA